MPPDPWLEALKLSPWAVFSGLVLTGIWSQEQVRLALDERHPATLAMIAAQRRWYRRYPLFNWIIWARDLPLDDDALTRHASRVRWSLWIALLGLPLAAFALAPWR